MESSGQAAQVTLGLLAKVHHPALHKHSTVTWWKQFLRPLNCTQTACSFEHKTYRFCSRLGSLSQLLWGLRGSLQHGEPVPTGHVRTVVNVCMAWDLVRTQLWHHFQGRQELSDSRGWDLSGLIHSVIPSTGLCSSRRPRVPCPCTIARRSSWPFSPCAVLVPVKDPKTALTSQDWLWTGLLLGGWLGCIWVI